MCSTPRPDKPAAGLSIALYRIDGDSRPHLKTASTNADGRCDAPLLPARISQGRIRAGVPRRRLSARAGDKLPDPAFLDVVPIRFGMAEQSHYHVPLLVSPYGYSTYRGS